jgi:Lon protease-like protein
MPDLPANGFLRLFPLQAVVLFPGMPLPLMVFEPRYLQLMKECTEADEPFGVLLLKEGAEVGPNPVEPYTVGTTAVIREVKPAGGGRLSVVSVGGERFRVRSFIHGHPYLAAEAELIDDQSAGLVEQPLIDNVREDTLTFVRAVLARRGEFVRDVDLPGDPTELSYHIAQLFQGSPRVQQQLLERDTFERLRDERHLIKAAIDQLINEGDQQRPGPPRFSPN